MSRRIIADYRLIARLGRGRLTDVYLGIRDGTAGARQLVVVKRLRADAAANGGTLFTGSPLDDARLSIRLRHPNIARTYDTGLDEGLPFRALEYVDGQPLDRILVAAASEGGLPERCAACVTHDVLQGLHHAHELSEADGSPLGLVHADVQPHNIFVSYLGQVKLVDFGAPRPRARAQGQTPDDGARYLAPEQLRALEPDRRTDLYQAGLVLWECLQPGHQGAAPQDPPGELAAVLARALTQDPAGRYASAAAMSGELAALLGDVPAARAELASLVQRLFHSERERRVQQLQELLGPARSEVGAPRSSAPPELRVHPSTPALGVLAARTAAFEAALAAEQVTQAEISGAEAVRLSMPHSEPPPSVRPPRRGLGRAASIGAVAVAGAALLTAGVFWLRSTPSAEAAAAKAITPDPAQAAAKTAQPAAETVLRLCGSNTIGAELAPALIEAFFAAKGGSDVTRRPGAAADESQVSASLGGKPLAVEISAHGSATAFSGLADGSCDVGMASRAIDERELALLRDKGHGDLRSAGTEHVIALDGIAVIVHPNNAVRALDRAALHDIFVGKLTDWSQLGGAAGPIKVLARDDRSGTYDTFKHLVLGKDPLLAGAARYEGSDALSDAVAGDPAAIGFVGLPYVRAARAVAVGDRGAPAMLPSHFSVATEGYLLSRRLYLYTLPTPRTPFVTELVSFAQTPRAQEVAARNQFIDLGLSLQPVPCDAHCPPQYAALVAKAERVSLDFRFRSGSDEPDSRAGRDLDRLVRRLGDLRDAKLYLLGFADTVGTPAANAALSLSRARAVARQLELRGVRPAAVRGFGASMPVADNTAEAGRERNRRVEAWIER